MPSLADDLLQDTFMQLHRSRRTYEPGRPVTPWVFAIARHVFLMHRRRTGRRLRFEDTLLAETRRADRPHDDVAALIDGDEIRRALRHVPADQRQAVLMHHVEGHSFAEIAGRLGIRVNAAKTRAFRGMKKMRETLTRVGTDSLRHDPMTTPTKLRDAIQEDLKPARPLRRPSTRALALLPVAAAILVGLPLLHAFRPDIAVIGLMRTWGLSIVQAIAGLVIVALALRESVPGRALSGSTVRAMVVFGLALPSAPRCWRRRDSTSALGRDWRWTEGLACFKTSALAAVPAIIVAAFLAARAFPLRPSRRCLVWAWRGADRRRRSASILRLFGAHPCAASLMAARWVRRCSPASSLACDRDAGR